MQAAAFSFSPSLSLPKPRIPSAPTASTPRFNPLPTPSPSRSLHFAPNSSLRRPPSICSTSPRFNGWISTPPVAPAERESGAVEVRAAESAGETEKTSSLKSTLQLGSLFGLCVEPSRLKIELYRRLAKQVLKVFPFPVTVTTVQFAVGTVLVLFMWTSNLYRRPKISGAQLLAILPLAMVHTLGNLFTNMSLGKVAVSFTHTIKAMEPFFSVVLSAMFLGEGLDVRQVYTRSLLAALCFHAYQQVSYMILQRVSPVTHSVGNCVKRVVVIVTSVLFFRTPVSSINSLGTGVALAGVFLYSRVKRIKPKPKSA
ncbi:hypothetical protein C3L33_14357, partial [Rhododendron williamsianum]